MRVFSTAQPQRGLRLSLGGVSRLDSLKWRRWSVVRPGLWFSMEQGCRLVRVCSAALLAVAAMAPRASAQCGTYSISTTMGGVITPGVDDTGNHCDDCTVSGIALPFTFY